MNSMAATIGMNGMIETTTYGKSSAPRHLQAFRPARMQNVHPAGLSDACALNQLLAMLPATVCDHLQELAMPGALDKGEVLYESGRPLQYVYFPTTATISLVHRLSDGAAPEFATVGREGMVGVHVVMGGTTTPYCAIVQQAGTALRLHRDDFLEQFERQGGRRNGALQEVVLRYSQALIAQLAQGSVCRGHHSLRQRLCRWLLTAGDRTLNDVLLVTHENIAALLGVRREGVTSAECQLQAAGLIAYNRGQVTLVDRGRLAHEACECYALISHEYRRLLDLHAHLARKATAAAWWPERLPVDQRDVA